MERVIDRELRKMTEEEYFALDAVSSSQLRYLAIEGPWHYYHRYVLKSLPPKDSESLRLGKLLHLAMERDDWRNLVYAFPQVDRRTKAGKAAWQESLDFVAEHKSIVVEQEQLDIVEQMVQSIYENPEAESYLGEGEREVVGLGTCASTGLLVKAKADLLRTDCIVDYKTTRKHSAEGFRKTALHDYGYQFQAEWYQRVFDREAFVIIAVTSEPPYESMVYEFTPPVIEEAQSMNDFQIGQLAQLMADDNPLVWHSENWGSRTELGYERLSR